MSLFDSFIIKNTFFKNRILTPSFNEGMAQRDGRISHVCFENYMKMAKQGSGVIILDSAYVSQHGKAYSQQVGISEEKHIIGLSNLVKYLKENEVVVGIRLSHAGAKTLESVCGCQPIGPSAYTFGKEYSMSREFDDIDVEEVTLHFVHAAERAVEAGFDIIELNCTQQHLLEQCIDPRFNTRTDKYGGSVENRLTLLSNIIRNIKKRIKKEIIISVIFPIGGKHGDSYNEATVKEIINTTEKAGIDVFHALSAYSTNKFAENDYTPLEITVKYTNQPIIIEGHIKTLSTLKELLQLNKAAIFCIDRILMNRSNWFQFLYKKIAS